MHLLIRILLFDLCFVFCFVSLKTTVGAAEPQITAEQRQQLEEAKRLNAEVVKLYQQGRSRDAIIPARQALAIRQQVLGEKHPDTATSLNNLGLLLHSLGDHAAARPYYEQALAIRKVMLGEKDPNTANSLNNLGGLLKSLGDSAAARAYYEQALAIRQQVLGEKHPDTATSLNNLGLLLHSLGDYAAARPYFEQAVAIRKEVLGEKHRDTAKSLDDLGSLLEAMRDYAAARTCYEQVLAIRKEVLGEKHSETATALNYLGLLLKETGDTAAARTHLEQALAIRKEVLGEKHPDTAVSLNNLGWLLHSHGDRASAQPYFEQALAIRKEVLGDKHPATVVSLNNLGLLLKDMGDYAAARTYLEQAVAIRKLLLGEKHLDTAKSLNDLGSLLEAMGNYAAARTCYEQSLAIRKEVLGEKHPDTATSLNNLGVLLLAQGDYAAARPYLSQALAIRKEVLGEKHPDTANSLHNLGSLLMSQGDYAAARPYLSQALAIRKEVLGEKHPDTANSLHNLGSLLMSLGDYAAARIYYEQSLAICKEVLGEKHPSTATSLSNLASLLMFLGDYAAARPYLSQALAIRKEVLGEKHPDTANSLHNLGSLLMSKGDYAAARPYLRQALAIRKEVLGEKHPDTANSLNNLGSLLMSQGDYAAARPCLSQALAIRKEVLGEKHPETARVLSNLAILEAADGNWNRSFEWMDEACHVARAHLVRTLPGMASAEQLRYLQTGEARPFRISMALAIERRTDPNVAATSAAWLVNGKATAQEALAQQAILASESRDPVIAESVKRLLATRRELANLVMATPKPGQEKACQQRLVQLENEEQSLSREVGRGTGRPNSDRVWIELDEVRQTMAADAVLVDLVRYIPYNFQPKPKESLWGTARYAAWLVPAAGQGEVEIVDLGPAAKIEALVSDFQKAVTIEAMVAELQNARREVNTLPQLKIDVLLARLAELIYKPLAGRLTFARHWLISPDGALWNVPWGALRLDEKTYAIEQHEISYLVSSRDLVNRPARGTSSEPVVLADPDYALSPAASRIAVQKILSYEQMVTHGSSTSFGDLLPKHWPRLPGTATEAAAIEPHLQRFAKKKPKVYLREKALESVAKNVQGPRVLVLSTHGFFLPDQAEQAPSSVGLDYTQRDKPGENPLLRCGLALAGADKLTDAPRDNETDDGLLTGLEIVACNLRGTELAVLSACETGLGDVQNGQGVAGLRQAFQLAGAECVMASLWGVEDQETAELMKSFFENLANGQTKAVALASAQRSRIAAHRKTFGNTHPGLWGAFTVTGM